MDSREFRSAKRVRCTVENTVFVKSGSHHLCAQRLVTRTQKWGCKESEFTFLIRIVLVLLRMHF